MKEIWKTVEGYTIYEISNLGRIRSFSRRKHGQLLTQLMGQYGYYLVCLFKDNSRRMRTIHTLVWDAFGDGKRNGHVLVVDHIDENKTNNKISNLQLLSQRENITKSRKLLKHKATSQYTGVHFHKLHKKYNARVTFEGKRVSLGNYDDEYSAHLVYEEARGILDRIEKGETLSPPYHLFKGEKYIS